MATCRRPWRWQDAAIFSIAFNLIRFRLMPRCERGMTSASREVPETVETERALPRPLIVAGSGDVARRVIRRGMRTGTSQVAVSDDDDALAAVREAGVETVNGDPARPEVLRAAHAAHSWRFRWPRAAAENLRSVGDP